MVLTRAPPHQTQRFSLDKQCVYSGEPFPRQMVCVIICHLLELTNGSFLTAHTKPTSSALCGLLATETEQILCSRLPLHVVK